MESDNIQQKGFTITIFGIGDYHPESEEEYKEDDRLDDLQLFLKEKTDEFIAHLRDEIKERNSFKVNSYINNIRLDGSNDKYPGSGSF